MEAVAADPRTTGRHFSALFSGQVVRYVESVRGAAGVDEMLALAGDVPSRDVLEDLSQWLSYDETRRLLEAAAQILGDSAGMDEVGSFYDVTGATTVFESLGSPAEIIRSIAEASAKFSTVVSVAAVEVSDDHGVVAASSMAGFPRYRLLCDITAGLLSQAAMIFGLPPSTVVEEECEARGDDRCLFRVSWATGWSEPERRMAALEYEATRLNSQMASLQATVRDLVSVSDLDELLDIIVGRAAHAVTAQRYLLALHPLRSDERMRVHHLGFTPTEAEALATVMLDRAPASRTAHDESVLVADVASGTRHYGRLVAVNQAGVSFLPGDQEPFEAYAELAAAALDSATALEDAKRQARAAEALLDLSRALTDATTSLDCAQRLAEAVGPVLDCQMASVFLCDESHEVLTSAGHHGLPDELAARLPGLQVVRSDTPLVDRIVTSRSPMFFRSGETDPFVQGWFDATGARTMVVAPIALGDRVYGSVTALSLTDNLHADDAVLGRLSGIADHGAIAMQNMELLEAARHEALHDPLTGTPNQRLLEDRLELALRQAERHDGHVGVLFLDLDRFKHVNDTFGHAAGDDLLRQVATRLRAAVRAVDTVSRLGGDEFVVLLPDLRDPGDADIVAKRVGRVLGRPFVVEGEEVIMSASIGTAVHPGAGDSYSSLLRAADASMYAAKTSSRSIRFVRPATTAISLS
jgi:diguanylate cyclase (GGDEF)-like protein